MSHQTSKIVDFDGFTFDDLLLLPRYTDFKRQEVDLTTQLHDSITLKLPILSSPMDTVTEQSMAVHMAKAGGLGVIHRNLSIQTQAEMVKNAKETAVEDAATAAVDGRGRYLVGAAVGPSSNLEECAKALMDVETDVIVIDSGHGHSKFMADSIKLIKKLNPKQVVMAGNVATKEGAEALVDAGADILRVGVGPGSICTTRIVTGMGVPQVAAILQALEGAKGRVKVVADGGIRQMGDMAKALGCGAHAVMLGSMLAGFDESAGDTVEVNGGTYKQYRGMGSVAAMQKGGAERYGQSAKTEAKKLIAEGVEGLVPLKGHVDEFLFQAGGSLRSAFYYVGSQTMDTFHKNAQFVRITNAGLLESHPHTIRVTSGGGSYLMK